MKRDIKEIWECVSRELRRRGTRTIVNILAYLIAISLLLTLVTFLSASKNVAESILRNTGVHFIVSKTAEDIAGSSLPEADAREGFFAAGVPSQPLPYNLVSQVASLKGVADASPYISYRAYNSKENHFFVFGGFDPAHPISVDATTCNPRDIVTGKFLKEDDRNVVMLHENYAIMRKLSVGDTVEIFNREFTVIGIVNPGIRPARADIYMHIEDAAELVRTHVPPVSLFTDLPINVVLVEGVSATFQDEVITGVKNLDNRLEINSYDCYIPAARAMLLNEQVLWFLTILVFVAAIIFSMRAQMASVLEREHDIGILKAIGWSNKVIVWQILLEASTQALVGGFLGCFLAILIVTFVPLHLVVGPPGLRLPGATIPAFLILPAILLSALGGIAAGIIPALNAAKKYPAEALRCI